MNKFKNDLLQGQIYEKKCLDYLDYDTVEYPPAGKFKDYDLTIIKKVEGKDIRTTIEVKSDRQASSTNNLCIEYECNNKPSGLTSTKADIWIYFIVFKDYDECYKIPTDELKELVKGTKKVIGGDSNLSKMYLLNKNKLQNYLIYSIKKNDNIYIVDNMNEVKPITFIDKLLDEFDKSDIETYTKDDVMDIIIKFSNREKELKKKNVGEMPFGKYKFKSVKEIAKFDKQYLVWLNKQEILNKYVELKEEIKKYI